MEVVEPVECVLGEEWVVGEGIAVRGDGEGVEGGREGGEAVDLV